MTTQTSTVLQGVSITFLSQWISILALIFGGCCSNAITLEQLTHDHPHTGKLLTFCQFLLITIHGLPKFVTFKPYPRLKPRQIPIFPFLVQVLLFYCISLLNNAAFAYAIPMPVHIIFRSGGLVINMLLNWLLLRRKYRTLQVASVMLVTSGVVLTTLSASSPNPKPASSSASDLPDDLEPLSYATGIAILTLALILSGFLGMVQDRTYAQYARRPASDGTKEIPGAEKSLPAAPWEESMFYLHFLSLPMFLFIRKDVVAQAKAISSGPMFHISLPSFLLPSNSTTPMSFYAMEESQFSSISQASLSIPKAYVPLFLNTLTQLFCVAGVNRLSARVSSLTVTLVLVVRKAVSLIISVMLFSAMGRGSSGGKTLEMWMGAALVFAGTVGYSLGSGKRDIDKSKAKKE